MPALSAATFTTQAQSLGFELYVGVPCSYLGPIIEAAQTTPGLRYVAAANEGDAVAMATGAALGGQGAIVLLQNSGLGNAVNPLSSLNRTADLPVLLLIGWRGEPARGADEPQHTLMGAITTPLLDLLGIRWELLPEDEAGLEAALARAGKVMRTERRPYALLVRKDGFTRDEATTASLAPPATERATWATRHPRLAYLAELQRAVRPTDLLVATTGYTGRELAALGDRPNQFYLVGAMGCAASLALGLAWARPERRVVVLDGDGALLMRLSALTTIGSERPTNLLHLVFDNEAYESTGAQRSVSGDLDVGAIARACGYPEVLHIETPDQLGALVRGGEAQLHFVHIKTSLCNTAPPRPPLSPPAVTARLQAWLST